MYVVCECVAYIPDPLSPGQWHDEGSCHFSHALSPLSLNPQKKILASVCVCVCGVGAPADVVQAKHAAHFVGAAASSGRPVHACMPSPRPIAWPCCGLWPCGYRMPDPS
jgi:hypothetical protein